MRFPIAAVGLTLVASGLMAACDQLAPSSGLEGVEDSVIIHIAKCSDQGVLDLKVMGNDRILWHLQAEAPQPVWEFPYGLIPDGFTAVRPHESLLAIEGLTVLTTVVTASGREVTTRDMFLTDRVRFGEVYVKNQEYLPPVEYQNWAARNVCPE